MHVHVDVIFEVVVVVVVVMVVETGVVAHVVVVEHEFGAQLRCD